MELYDIIQWAVVALTMVVAVVVIVRKVCRFSKGLGKGETGCGCGCSGCDLPCAKREEQQADKSGKGGSSVH